MKFTKKLLPLGLLSLTLVFTSCGDDDASNAINEVKDVVGDVKDDVKEMTIAEFAIGNSNYSSLVAALTRAGLVDAVSDPNANLTVFAPDNAAFDRFLNGAELEDVDKDVLAQILLNHVLGSEVKASTVLSTAPGYIKNLANGPKDASDKDTNISTFYSVKDSKVFINGTIEVTTADAFDASNGVIHAVKDVIPLPTVVTFATADPNFSTLVTALTTSTPGTDFVSILSGEVGADGSSAPFTVFAPNNAAFDKLDAIPEESALVPILQHHVVAGANVVSTDLADPTPVDTLNGSFTINLPGNDGNPAKITDGNGNTDIDIIAVDVQAANGVIHVVESVLIPAPAVILAEEK